MRHRADKPQTTKKSDFDLAFVQLRIFAPLWRSLLAVVLLLGLVSVHARASVLLSQERSRAAVDQAIAEGRKLRAQNTPDSLKGAIARFEQALVLLEGAGDTRMEADILTGIGQIYLVGLGETQKALDYYNRALPLRRAAGDRPGES